MMRAVRHPFSYVRWVCYPSQGGTGWRGTALQVFTWFWRKGRGGLPGRDVVVISAIDNDV